MKIYVYLHLFLYLYLCTYIYIVFKIYDYIHIYLFIFVYLFYVDVYVIITGVLEKNLFHIDRALRFCILTCEQWTFRGLRTFFCPGAGRWQKDCEVKKFLKPTGWKSQEWLFQVMFQNQNRVHWLRSWGRCSGTSHIASSTSLASSPAANPFGSSSSRAHPQTPRHLPHGASKQPGSCMSVLSLWTSACHPGRGASQRGPYSSHSQTRRPLSNLLMSPMPGQISKNLPGQSSK